VTVRMTPSVRASPKMASRSIGEVMKLVALLLHYYRKALGTAQTPLRKGNGSPKGRLSVEARGDDGFPLRMSGPLRFEPFEYGSGAGDHPFTSCEQV
jgi:hypothetical protein